MRGGVFVLRREPESTQMSGNRFLDDPLFSIEPDSRRFSS
jgi:hypothetical protein